MRVYPVKFGSYSLLGPLGEGPLGDVHRATTESGPLASQPIVIKRISPLFSRERRFRDAFLARAAVVSQIQHPHLMPVLDRGELDGCLFTITELTGAVSLHTVMAYLRSTGVVIPQNLAVALVLQLCEGVEALRRERVGGVPLVHGNIKPSNILVDHRGVARLTDVSAGPGVAGSLSQVWWVARDGIPYMAPELLSGRPLEPQADVFALASLLSELLTLTPLVEVTSPFETLGRLARLDLKVVMARLTQAGFSREFIELLEWALDPDPDRRLEDASSFADALAELGPGEGMWVTPDIYWTDLLASVQGTGGDKLSAEDAGWDLMALDMMAAGAAMELEGEGEDGGATSGLSSWENRSGRGGSGLRLVDADVGSVASLESLVSSSLAMDPSLDETAEFRADEADDDLDMTPRFETRARPEVTNLSAPPPREENKVATPATSSPSPTRSRANWNTGPLVVMSEELAQEPEEDETSGDDDGSGDEDDGGFDDEEGGFDDEAGFEGDDDEEDEDGDDDDDDEAAAPAGSGDGESVDDALAAEEADNIDDDEASADEAAEADEGAAEYAGEDEGEADEEAEEEAADDDGAAYFPGEDATAAEEMTEDAGVEGVDAPEVEDNNTPPVQGSFDDQGAADSSAPEEGSTPFDAAALSFFKEGDPMLRDTLVLSREQIAKLTGRPTSTRVPLSTTTPSLTTSPPVTAAPTPPAAGAPRTVILSKSEIQRLLHAELDDASQNAPAPVVEPPPRAAPASLGERSSLGPLWSLLATNSSVEVMEAGAAEEDEEGVAPAVPSPAALDETSLFFDVLATGDEPTAAPDEDGAFEVAGEESSPGEEEPTPMVDEGEFDDDDATFAADEGELGGIPTDEEAAAALDMTGEEVVDAFAAWDAATRSAHPDEAAGGQGAHTSGQEPAEDDEEEDGEDEAGVITSEDDEGFAIGGEEESFGEVGEVAAEDEDEETYRTTDELPVAVMVPPAQAPDGESEITPVEAHVSLDPGGNPAVVESATSASDRVTLSGFSTLDGESEPLDDVGDLIAEFDGAISSLGRPRRPGRPTEVLEADPLHDPQRLRRLLAEGGKRRSPLPDGTVMDGVLQVVRRVEVGPSRSIYEAVPNPDLALHRCWECGYTRNTRNDVRCSRCHEPLTARTFAVSCRWDKRLVEREIAMAGRRLAHPSLGRIHGFLAHEGMICRILDVRGPNIFTFKGRNLPEAQAVRIGIDLCSAAAYLAELGVAVVDIMPANVILTEGGAQLYDPDVAEVSDVPLAEGLRARMASSIARLLAGHLPLESKALQAMLAGPSEGRLADPAELASALSQFQSMTPRG